VTQMLEAIKTEIQSKQSVKLD